MSETEEIKQIEDWRRRLKLPAGHPEEMTLGDYREAIKALRQSRMVAASLAEAKKTAKKTADPAAKAAQILEGW